LFLKREVLNMDVQSLITWVVENWEMLAVVACGSGYGVKLKLAVDKTKAALEEMRETRDVVVAALKPDEAGDTVITEAEAKEIAREVQEDFVAVHAAVDSILGAIPPVVRAKVVAFFKRDKTT